MFRLCANFYEGGNSGVRVTATSGKISAVFSLDFKRSAVFFKDREVTLNDKGSKKRIFHIVKPHRRIYAGGEERYVRMHFRGERSFTWNGYDMLVTVPGLHHFDVTRFDVGAHIIDETEDRTGMSSMKDVGKMIRDHVRGRRVS